MSSPQQFSTVIADFVTDLKTVFPEYTPLFNNVVNKDVLKHCLTVYPERFFDILYSNTDIFETTIKPMWSFYPVLILECYGIQMA